MAPTKSSTKRSTAKRSTAKPSAAKTAGPAATISCPRCQEGVAHLAVQNEDGVGYTCLNPSCGYSFTEGTGDTAPAA